MKFKPLTAKLQSLSPRPKSPEANPRTVHSPESIIVFWLRVYLIGDALELSLCFPSAASDKSTSSPVIQVLRQLLLVAHF